MEDKKENSELKEKKEQATGGRGFRAGDRNVWFALLFLLLLMLLYFALQGQQYTVIDESFFIAQLEADRIASIRSVGENKLEGQFRDPPPDMPADSEGVIPSGKDGKPKLCNEKFRVELRPNRSENEKQRLDQLFLNNGVRVSSRQAEDNSTKFMLVASILLPLAILFFLWMMIRRTRDQLMGGGFLSGFTKSNAHRYEQPDHPTTFEDVAGCEGVKADLQELVEFLKDSEKFQRLGGRVPKGVLLNGLPGTGKTLLARAVAGEAGVPFYTVNGSEFIQMFVGVGASRVRDLFKTAKDSSPSIVFIDEIDAVGRQRGAGLGGGHDEREQTLNQILSEMDGFTQTDSVIVIAATNRPDVLDPALLRPGRFDRHITVDRPTLKGREEIFKVHVRDVPLADEVDLNRLAAGTVGLTGADIRNLVNEAALRATREDKDKVGMADFEYSRDKILMGPKREELLLGKEKEKTAYHEAGHALIAWLTKGADRVHKVTVIPRGRALGVTQTLPEEDRMNISEHELRDRLAFLLGGRSAEKLVYDEYSAGAENDLERATELARRMITKWGMSKRLGPVSYKLSDEDPFLGREMHQQRQFSEHTMQIIDEEIAHVLHSACDRATQILNGNRDKLDLLATALVDREEVSESEITEIIGPSVHHADDEVQANGASEIAADSVASQY